ncbi:hypothetical protein Slin15195_G076990 [Septoria linicola]|uniref:Uncharacterized protein n=1 Tax=Septoria linicola TaxID=215465 RepID=A0A9Q9ASM6_9PEZI|nr:hypothetical protein Slin14017_G038160 [Septoria linicola]USW54380.1 hypothetical protein Slin15195_G076990 [Septoria linicola]
MGLHGLLRRAEVVARSWKVAFLVTRHPRMLSNGKRLASTNQTGDIFGSYSDSQVETPPSYTRRFWTDAELETLYKMRQESNSAFRIAQALGRTTKSVQYMSRKANQISLDALKKTFNFNRRACTT